MWICSDYVVDRVRRDRTVRRHSFLKEVTFFDSGGSNFVGTKLKYIPSSIIFSKLMFMSLHSASYLKSTA